MELLGSPIAEWNSHKFEKRVDYITMEETTRTINSLKN